MGKQSGSGNSILVIDDDPDIRKLLRALLEREGRRVTEAATAEVGLESARKSVPDLILMDIRLPGIDGLEATRRVRADENLCSIPVVAISAYAMNEDVDAALAAGCSDYVTKPIDSARLAAVVSAYLD